MKIRIVRYRTRTMIAPFEDPAAQMPVLGDAGITTLCLFQEDQIARALRDDLRDEVSASPVETADNVDAACVLTAGGDALIFADDLWFSAEFVELFIHAVRTTAIAPSPGLLQAALPSQSPMVRDFILPLGETEQCDIGGQAHCLLPMFFKRVPLPLASGQVEPLTADAQDTHEKYVTTAPVAVPFQPFDCEHLSLPPIGEAADDRFAYFRAQLPAALDFAPLRISTARVAALPLRHWSHLLTANLIFAVYGDMLRFAAGAEPMVFGNGTRGGPQPDVRKLVVVGRNARIDPSATIIGPTVIGDDVTIEAGACVSAAVIGNGCIIGQGAHIRLSALGDYTILPPGGGNLLLWSQTFGQSLINSPLRYSVIGRDCFVSAQVSVTDRILEDGEHSARVSFGGREVRVRTHSGLRPSGYWFLGVGIGTGCRIGSGLQFYPGRMLPAHSRVYAHSVDSDFAIDPVRSLARQRTEATAAARNDGHKSVVVDHDHDQESTSMQAT